MHNNGDVDGRGGHVVVIAIILLFLFRWCPQSKQLRLLRQDDDSSFQGFPPRHSVRNYCLSTQSIVCHAAAERERVSE
jgi:hypothetical protein